ncbi:MFS transporter [Lactobacillus panisapium]|uniref:MDR family MFS transporter n=1 Tax=Lactobacillus TaxID=1578 RepID=UPI000CDA9FF4|nr:MULTISPECIES: MDR family MFS transporter [Lactobacillus]MCO6532387.1 MFS transporter [Lactobacillus sp.]MCO6533990.1 MFS transporter [Lactobacillus sp.]MCT6853429.1 MFS transporter [Lactobacillus panisapium]MCT6865772.1 MFS transporter [Lactobacillus panisapium]MCX8725473.1 MFS transporter [Lactobacillus sp. B4007]
MKKTNVPIVTLAIFMTTFMTAIEGTIVSTAMPTIVSDLNGLEIMNWVVSIFLFMTAVSTPLYGKLADSIGRKPIFLFGIALFVIGSALCGQANNMLELILFRVIQGLGSGAVQPVAMTIIADMYTLEKRTKMLGLNSGFWGVASVIAPLLGGFIVQNLSWHWVFYINVPIGLIAFLLVVVFLSEPKAKKKTKLDVKGTFWLVVLLLTLMFTLQELSSLSPIILLALAALIILSAMMFYHEEKRAEDPIMPLTMLKGREFLAVNMITLFISGVVIGFEFYIPTWMQGIKGTSATIAGFAVTPSSVMWVIGSFLIGGMLSRWGVRKTFFGMLTLLLLADCMLLIVPVHTPFWVFCIIATMNGFAFGSVMTAAQVRSQVLVDQNNVGVATSFNTLMRYLGQTMMVSIYGITFNTIVASQLAKHPNLTQSMMNKIVSAEKAKELAANLIPQLRQVLFSALKGVYTVSLVAIVLSIIFNCIYKKKQEN